MTRVIKKTGKNAYFKPKIKNLVNLLQKVFLKCKPLTFCLYILYFKSYQEVTNNDR